MNQVNKIDKLNIFLIVISFVLAILLPFKLFLFSYVVLGPLHYMTEIGWLKERKYFSKSTKGVYFLIGMAFIITIGIILLYAGSVSFLNGIQDFAWYNQAIETVQIINPACIFIAFISAFVFALIEDKKKGLFIIGLSVLISFFIYSNKHFNIIFGVFIPTILHVSLFTILFMIYGALKSKSKLGLWNAVLFTVLCFSFFFFNFKAMNYTVSAELANRLIQSTFSSVNADFAKFLGLHGDSTFDVISNIGFQMQAFLSFVYTYHYLNWFSKTKIINWHKVSTRWLVIAGVIWISSVALYMFDMMLGLLALAFLSLVHVFLEFPLNHLSIHGIYRELKLVFNKGKVS